MYESTEDLDFLERIYDEPAEETPIKSVPEACLDDIETDLKAQIAYYEGQLEMMRVEQPPSSLSTSFDEAVSELCAAVSARIQRISDSAVLLDPTPLQKYLQLDEELSTALSVFYTKHCAESLELITADSHHSCIVSAEGSEYAQLMSKRTEVQDTWLSNLKQRVLAEAVKAKYDQALKTFESQVRREAQDKFLPETTLQTYIAELKLQSEDLSKRIESLLGQEIPGKLREIGELSAAAAGFDDEQSENEWAFSYFSKLISDLCALLMRQKVLSIQQRNLIATCLILSEQQLVQREYDQIHLLQTRLEDLHNQANFRIEKYGQLTLRNELLYGQSRTTVDSREKTMREIAEGVGAATGELRLSELIKKCAEVQENIGKTIQTERKILADHLESLRKG